MGILEIKDATENEIIALNNQGKKLDILNSAVKAFEEKKVDELIERCEYRIGNLKNAHLHSSVANQDEIERDNLELNSSVANLNNEILDLENIRKVLGTPFDIQSYDEIANNLVSIIDEQLNRANATVAKSRDALDHNFDNMAMNNQEIVTTPDKPMENIFEPKFEPRFEHKIEPITEVSLNPTEIKKDSLDELSNIIDKEMEPIQESKKVLEETSKILNDGFSPVVSRVEAPEHLTAPVLMPQENPSLDEIINKEIEQDQSKIDDYVPEGFIKVIDVIDLSKNNNLQESGPTLSRIA